MPLGLALHTTTEVLSLAIARLEDRVEAQVGNRELILLKQQSWQLGRNLSTQLHPLLAEFMRDRDWAELAFVAIAKGVGSFTGTRIGIVLARTLGEQLAIPVYAIGCDEIDERSQQLRGTQSPGEILLSISQEQWLQKKYPHWAEALPLYSSD